MEPASPASRSPRGTGFATPPGSQGSPLTGSPLGTTAVSRPQGTGLAFASCDSVYPLTARGYGRDHVANIEV